MKHIIVILALCAIVNGGVRKEIFGELSGVYPAGDYFVTGTIYVLRGKTLHFEAGSRLYFEQFSGVTVFGTLILEGSDEQPVTLTSAQKLPERRQTPESFDWNGVELNADAVLMNAENTIITHSVFGFNIKSHQTPVSLTNVQFDNIGYASVVRDGKIVTLLPEKPYSNQWNISSGD
ncbi:hypothetical protein QA601_05755 [Chitinispirillales bacterium ANBcel5]|uniref:hypothetical protein n=1 Tax=Cellulosispirillum alkaliphilum TaxID=3039283 RepID=UPI002A58646D|nr:hypothetical protein [Chitinispirillales bacterium ANBcel5]